MVTPIPPNTKVLMERSLNLSLENLSLVSLSLSLSLPPSLKSLPPLPPSTLDSEK